MLHITRANPLEPRLLVKAPEFLVRDQQHAIVQARRREAAQVFGEQTGGDPVSLVCTRHADGVDADRARARLVRRHGLVRQRGGGGERRADVADQCTRGGVRGEE